MEKRKNQMYGGPLTQEEITVTQGQSRGEIKRSRGLPKNGFSNNGPDSTQGLQAIGQPPGEIKVSIREGHALRTSNCHMEPIHLSDMDPSSLCKSCGTHLQI